MPYRISVDTGGTFTDVVVTDSDGRFTVGKALTDKHLTPAGSLRERPCANGTIIDNLGDSFACGEIGDTALK